VQCTLQECSGDSLWNRERVENFSRQLYSASDGHRRPVGCLYDPWDVKSAAALTASVPVGQGRGLDGLDFSVSRPSRLGLGPGLDLDLGLVSDEMLSQLSV